MIHFTEILPQFLFLKDGIGVHPARGQDLNHSSQKKSIYILRKTLIAEYHQPPQHKTKQRGVQEDLRNLDFQSVFSSEPIIGECQLSEFGSDHRSWTCGWLECGSLVLEIQLPLHLQEESQNPYGSLPQKGSRTFDSYMFWQIKRACDCVLDITVVVVVVDVVVTVAVVCCCDSFLIHVAYLHRLAHRRMAREGQIRLYFLDGLRKEVPGPVVRRITCQGTSPYPTWGSSEHHRPTRADW